MALAAVDLFCGVGGLTNGIIRTGINVVAGIDIDGTCQYAYEKNNESIFIEKNIKEITSEEINNLFPENHTKLLMGCAPCKPFSRYTNRYNKEGEVDSKWGLLYSFGNLIRETEPELISMENVPQIANEIVFLDFVELLKELNYFVSWEIVYCPDYGVPQNRRRLVLLASKFGELNLIPPIYTKANYRTVRETIGQLPPIISGGSSDEDPLHKSSLLSTINQERMIQSIPGGTWRDWEKRLLVPCHIKDTGKSYPSVYGRMEWDKPAPTITTQFYGYGNGRYGHPEQNRAISLREGAILQTFPDDYEFIDPDKKITMRQLGTHIGNAVPVKLGEAVGLSILAHLELYEVNV